MFLLSKIATFQDLRIQNIDTAALPSNFKIRIAKYKILLFLTFQILEEKWEGMRDARIKMHHNTDRRLLIAE